MDPKFQREEEFNILLLQAIEETISCLGESPTRKIYFYMDKKFSLTVSDVPSRLEEYSHALETMLGVGAKILEHRIVRRLSQRTQTTIQNSIPSDANFTESIHIVKINFLRNDRYSSSFSIGVNEELLESKTGIQVSSP